MIARTTLVFLAVALLVAGGHAQRPPQAPPVAQRTDSLGDPLPDGAVARLGTLRLKHDPVTSPVVDVALFSPDGAKIVSLVYGHGSVRLWDAATGKEIRGPWTSSNPRHTAVAFSPDGALLAAATYPRFKKVSKTKKEISQGEVILYDIAGAKPVKTLFYDLPGARPVKTLLGFVHALTFADGGKTLVAAGQGTVRWWDIASGKERRSWQPFPEETQPIQGATKTKTFRNCALAPDGKSLAVQVAWQIEKAGMGKAFPQRGFEPVEQDAIGYDLATGKMTWRSTAKGPAREMSRFAFSADGKRVAVAMGPSKVEARDTVTGKLIAKPLEGDILGSNTPGGVALSSDGRTAAVAVGASKVVLWNTDDATPPRRFVSRIAQYWPYSAQCLHFSPDNKTLLVGADADLQLYDALTLKEVRPWEGHRGWIGYLAFSPDGKRLFTGSAELEFHSQELAAWDTASWKRLQLTSIANPPWPNLGVASPERSVFVGKTGDERFRFYDLASGKVLGRFNVPSKQPAETRGFFSPSGKLYVLEGSDDKGKDIERLYAVPSGKLLAQLPHLVTMHERIESARPIAFSFDEKLIAVFGLYDGMIHVCDATTGKVRHRLGTRSDQDGPVEDGGFAAHLDFSKDGKLLASWKMTDNLIHVWDMATGKELLQIVPNELEAPFPGSYYDQGRVHFAWSPDSRTLAVGQNKIRLWELATQGVRHELAGHQDAPVRALAFSPSGRVLASGSADTTVLIWDMSISVGPGAAVTVLERGDLAKRWQALAEDDAAKAFAAIRDLAADPTQSVDWIKEKIKPADPIDVKRAEELIGQLDADQFKLRQKAMAELLRIGERVVPTIDKVLAGSPALETHLRLQELRKRMTGLVLKGDRLRAYRAVEILEKIGTPQARQVLEALARGANGALVTTQARGALERWEK